MADWGPDPFNETADLTPRIRQALNSVNPASTLRDEWPWVPVTARLQFVARARTAFDPADLEVLVARYQHAIRAEYAHRYIQTPRRTWRPRSLRRRKGEHQ